MLIVPIGYGMSKSIHTPDHLRLRELLTTARKAAGLTQEEVAGRLDRPQSFVAKYEGGERRIDVIEFIAIVRALEREPVKMFEELVHTCKDSGRSRRS